jgi:hypothetical protein
VRRAAGGTDGRRPPGFDEERRAGIHATFGLLKSTPYSADHLSRYAAEELLNRLALVLLQSLGGGKSSTNLYGVPKALQ